MNFTIWADEFLLCSLKYRLRNVKNNFEKKNDKFGRKNKLGLIHKQNRYNK